MVDLKQTLSRFLSIPGVRLAVLVGRDGLMIEGLTRDGKEDMEAVAAMMTSGLNTAEALGQEIARGNVVGVLHEYEHGLVSVDPLGEKEDEIKIKKEKRKKENEKKSKIWIKVGEKCGKSNEDKGSSLKREK